MQRRVEIGGKKVTVDSQLEERVLLWLENHGFHERWRKPDVGLHYLGSNYTPDIELLIELDGMTHLAIVEIKPVLEGRYGFSPYIFKRMRQAAKLYFSKVLLLYVDKTQTWYRIDAKTGELTEFGTPKPAAKTIDISYKPFTIPSRSIWSHRYKQRLDHALFNSVLNFTADVLKAFVVALFTNPKPRRRRRR